MNAPLRILLVDDEPLARLRLRALLQETADPPLQIVGEAGDAQQAMDLLRVQPCELVLLDIRMPGRDGLQLADALRRLPQPPSIVFVTAHGSHALNAFELDAVDYLTKPVRRERLLAALQRVAQRRSAAPSAPAALDDAPVLVVNDRTRMLRIPLDEVLYLRAGMKHVMLQTTTRSHVLDESLTELEQRLGPGFIRIHRNALVSRRAVRELQRRSDSGADEGWAVRVAPGDAWLPVSRRQVGAVREALGASSQRQSTPP